jgi:hypothetical protein
MNGTKIRDVHENGIIALSSLDRGTYTFNIRVIDKEGNVVTQNPSNNISIQRNHSIP